MHPLTITNMPPEETETRLVAEDEQDVESPFAPQYLYIIRHGDRWDYENPLWSKTSPRPGDPPLSKLGHQQARETGLFLNVLFKQDNITVDDITWLSSPFLRCLQTSNEALNALTLADSRKISILPESSVFEWDCKGGSWHDSLPPLEERWHYFPRLDLSYESMFVPTLPESRELFHQRCELAMSALHTRFAFRPKTALVIVTHAAACIGLTRVATQTTLADINPAVPCGIYRLSRRNGDQTVWDIDACDKPGTNFNGHTDHLSSISGRTVAWNNFGDKNNHRGYTGPPTSKFAPPELRNGS